MANMYKTVIENAIASFNNIQDALSGLNAKYTDSAGTLKDIPLVSSNSILVPAAQLSNIIQEQLQLKVNGNIELTQQTGTDVSRFATASVRNASTFTLTGTAKNSTNVSIGTLTSGYYPITANVEAKLTAKTPGWFTSGSASQSYVVGRMQAAKVKLENTGDGNLVGTANFTKNISDETTVSSINITSDTSIGDLVNGEGGITSVYPYFISIKSNGETNSTEVKTNASVETAGYIPTNYSFTSNVSNIKGTVSGTTYIPVKKAAIQNISMSGENSLSTNVSAETTALLDENDTKNITGILIGNRVHEKPTDENNYYIALNVNPTGGESKATTITGSSKVTSSGFIRSSDGIGSGSRVVSFSTNLTPHQDYYPIKKATFKYVKDSTSGANFIECLTSGYIASGAITNFDSEASTPDYAIISSTISGTGINKTSGYKLSLSNVINPGYISQSNGSISLNGNFYITKTTPNSTYFTETSGSTSGTGISASAMSPGFINGLADSGKTIYIKSGSAILNGGGLKSTVDSINGVNAELSDINSNGLGISVVANSTASGNNITASVTPGWISSISAKGLSDATGSKTKYLTKLTIPFVSGKTFGSYTSSTNFSNGIELAGTAYSQMTASTADLRIREYGETNSAPIQVIKSGKLVEGSISGSATPVVNVAAPKASSAFVSLTDTSSGIYFNSDANTSAGNLTYTKKAGWIKDGTGNLTLNAATTKTSKNTYLTAATIAADKKLASLIINAKGSGTAAGILTTLTNNGTITTLNGTGTIGSLTGTQTINSLTGIISGTISASNTTAKISANVGGTSYTFVENGKVKSGSVTPKIANSGLGTYFDTLISGTNANMTLTPQYTSTPGYIGLHTTAVNGSPSYYSIKTTSIATIVSNASVVSNPTSPTANKGKAKTTTSANANYVTISVSSGATANVSNAGWISAGSKTQTTANGSTAYIDAALTPTLTGATLNQTADFTSLNMSTAQTSTEPTSNKTSTSGLISTNKDKYIISGEYATSVCGPETTGNCVDWYVEALYRRMSGETYATVAADQ